jgi:SAM-dependent methyltransferase
MPAALASLEEEFARLGRSSPWMASFRIDGRTYGSGLNHEADVRPPHFFRLVPSPKRILELGSCQGGGTFQLAKHPGVEEVIAIEGRDFNLAKARFVQELLGIRNVRFLQGDLETFNLRALDRFDAVYCVGLLYHLPNPWDILAQLSDLTELVYLNTHYCPKNQVELTIGGYQGKKWKEFGYADPLSGLSSWSFWPTLESLAHMFLDTGFVPEIFDTDTTGAGQSPHGAIILARRMESLKENEQTEMRTKMERVLVNLPPFAGDLPQQRKARKFHAWFKNLFRAWE